jgi:hypothetical protein
MARSMRSNQRPDTLTQDRSPPTRRRLLQRTAGPYIGSFSTFLLTRPDVRYYTESVRKSGHGRARRQSNRAPRAHVAFVVASLIGRLGSSAFRLSTFSVSTSLAGSCFSTESAHRPFHHGIRGRGGTIFRAALPSDERQVQATKRTHLIHRPARDIMPPRGGARVSSYSL